MAQEDHNNNYDDKNDTDNYANDHSCVGTIIWKINMDRLQ